jgi:hypothetical protein
MFGWNPRCRTYRYRGPTIHVFLTLFLITTDTKYSSYHLLSLALFSNALWFLEKDISEVTSNTKSKFTKLSFFCCCYCCCLFAFSVFALLELKPRASYLLGKQSTNWSMSPTLLFLSCFWHRVLQSLPRLASNLWSSCLHLLSDKLSLHKFNIY